MEMSRTKAEFIAASEGVKQVFWLKRLFGELGGNGSEVIALYVDNSRAVKLAKKSRDS
jgi:hypothetical protein